MGQSRSLFEKPESHQGPQSPFPPLVSEASSLTRRERKAEAKIRNPKWKSQKGKRYFMTPARLATSLANLEKARAAPKELVYRPTVRRLLACRASLLKALRTKRERLSDGRQLKTQPDRLRPVKKRFHAISEVPHDDAQENKG